MTIQGTPIETESLRKLYQEFELDPDNIPTHIACVMDGNGRWAKSKGKPRIFGHKAGAEAMRRIIKACEKLHIRYLTVYAFSTENWSRPEKEVQFLMAFFTELLDREVPKMHDEGLRIRFGGRRDQLSDKLREKIEWAEKLTDKNTTLQVNIMLNYGARQEIVDAVNSWVKTKDADEPFSAEVMNAHLYIPETPDPDLLIRSSGESRISNFLLWQIAYSELVFEPTLWPDFNFDTLVNCIKLYQSRQRRFGGI